MRFDTKAHWEKVNMNKYVICCDFDGVLHSYTSGWKGPTVIEDPPVPGALEWLIDVAQDDFFEVAIYSSRSKEMHGTLAMRTWLQQHLYRHFLLTYPSPEAWSRSMEVVSNLTWPTQKPAASMTIDDRAFCFEGTFPTKQWLRAFKPWNKR